MNLEKLKGLRQETTAPTFVYYTGDVIEIYDTTGKKLMEQKLQPEDDPVIVAEKLAIELSYRMARGINRIVLATTVAQQKTLFELPREEEDDPLD